MEDQLNGALAKDIYVKVSNDIPNDQNRETDWYQHVILIGGFANSVSLKKHLRQRLEEFNRHHGTKTILVKPDIP